MNKLLIISSEFPPGPGGIGTHAFYLAQVLSKLGWEVCVLTRQDYVEQSAVDEFNRQQIFQIILVNVLF